MKIFIYCSEILNKPVLDAGGQALGVLHDVVMNLSEDFVYPRAAGLVIRRGGLRKEYADIGIDEITQIEPVLKLKSSLSDIRFHANATKCDFSVCADILDRQVVDTDDQKVVRVNDVHLLRVDNHLYLAHVEVGLRGIIRRLGWEPFVDGVIRLFSPKSAYLVKEDLISWKNTQALSLGRTRNILRLQVARQKLSQIPPTELAEIMEDLDIFEKMTLYKSLDVDVRRKVFTDMPPAEKAEIIDQMKDAEVAELLEHIPADEATDLLMTLPRSKTANLMRLMHTKTSKRLLKLLGFAKDSAGGLMTTEYLSLSRDATVKNGIELIKNNADFPGNIYHIYITDENNRLLGATSLRRFINEDPDKPLIETCYPKNIYVHTDEEMEEIALLLEKHKFTSIAVLDDEDVLQGVITSDDVMEELISLAWTKYKEKL